MDISIVGTGYVGIVTGVSLAEIGHKVICVDIDEEKVDKLRRGISPIYEPGLSELMAKNTERNNLSFTTNHREAFQNSEVIYIAVGTPENEDGSANLKYIEWVSKDIAKFLIRDTIVVTKSTVPVGTNDSIERIIRENLINKVRVEVVSNPEFLKEGCGIRDSFHGDRIIIGAVSEYAGNIVEEINKPFGIPIFKTDRRSAEMIKYASNAFLATKISFINEISNICELLGADVEKVATGMGMDQRIGSQFLKAGIGYGGSCFPKDTKALIQIAGHVKYDFELLKGVVSVNKKQQALLVNKLNSCFPSLTGKKIAVLGLAFKPETDDMREAASILITEELIRQGAQVIAYDPVAIDKAREVLNSGVEYSYSIEESITEADAVLIVTEWKEIKNLHPSTFKKMKQPLVIDGRNCFELTAMRDYKIEYHSIGRAAVKESIESLSI